jgi:hypothetical protein
MKIETVEYHDLIATRVPPGDQWVLVEDKNKVVVVLVNQGGAVEADLPELKKHKKIDSYVTSETNNLAYQSVKSEKIQVPKQSIVTLVYHIK